MDFAEYTPGADPRSVGAAFVVQVPGEDELAACLDLLHLYDSSSQLEVHHLARDLHDPNRLVVVASLAGQVVGYGRCARHDSSADIPDAAPSGYYLTGLVVHPAWRRAGIGKALTHERMRWTFARSPEVWYFINARNRASLALHRKIGFKEITRQFAFPGVTFEGGTGVLCRAHRDQRGYGPETGPAKLT